MAPNQEELASPHERPLSTRMMPWLIIGLILALGFLWIKFVTLAPTKPLTAEQLAALHERSREQRKAADAVRKSGKQLVYDYPWGPGGPHPPLEHIHQAGPDAYGVVISAPWQDSAATDADLVHLRAFKRLQTLLLTNASISDSCAWRIFAISRR